MHKTFAEHWLIRGLPAEAQSALYRLGEVLEVGTDQVLIEANTPNHEMYLLLQGAFKVNLPDRPGRIGGLTLGHRGPGDLLGEYSFFDAFRPTARVTASTPGLVLRIRHEALRDLLAANSAVSSVVYRNMLSYLVGRLRAQDEELDCYMF
ncbi:MAG: cyclic nucleotide-binding domain-containing protein [Chromatiaceae bacterium]|nr:cyclic nucleotide-binding domain-containing protein [Chromatiaceae bacterium]